MRTTRRVLAAAVAAVFLLGSSAVALGQAEDASEGPRYFYGELEGFLHPDVDNPFECGVGFTSDSMLFGQTELLGATTIRQVNCFVPSDTLDNVQGLVITITAENGDTLTGEGAGNGDCIPDHVPDAGGYYSCWGAFGITGGTGDFEGASGEIHTIVYTWNTQSDHPDAAPGDTPVMALLEGLVDY